MQCRTEFSAEKLPVPVALCLVSRDRVECSGVDPEQKRKKSALNLLHGVVLETIVFVFHYVRILDNQMIFKIFSAEWPLLVLHLGISFFFIPHK